MAGYNRRSKLITQGVARSPNRAMLRAVGFGDADFDKPIVGAVNGQCMDGVLCVGGCDKNMPGAMMAMARINVPGLFVYAGTIKPGFWKGQKLTIVSPFEAVGAFSAGKMSREDFEGIERNACP